ncbi:hypothetical protein pb186bvf_007497 [Paramecium bursaria]
MKKDRQNLYFIVINKTGGLQFFTQLKEVYREDQEKMSSNQALSASSVFYAIDHLTQTIIPEFVNKAEGENDLENAIEMLVTDQYMVSCLLTMTGLRFITLQNVNLLQQKQLQQMNPMQQQAALNQQQQELQRRHEEALTKMKQLYRLYTDYFSKDPFQEHDQPLGGSKRQQFDRDVRDLLDY